jgi:transcriptional regulator with XRE-family HTH domain
MTIFGQMIRTKRIELGLTQQFVSDATDVYLATLWNYELGGREPKLSRAVQICRVLDISPDEMFAAFEGENDNAKDQ